jgi:hypothetical protein
MLPAVGMSAKGAASIAGGAAVGGVTAATDTLFNNIYYDEATSLRDAGVQGAMFGAFGHSFGSITEQSLRKVLPNTPYIPMYGPVPPFSVDKGADNPLPAQIGNRISNTIGVAPSFIPSDNGTEPTTENKSDGVQK